MPSTAMTIVGSNTHNNCPYILFPEMACIECELNHPNLITDTQTDDSHVTVMYDARAI